jgi:putative transposase
MGKWLICVFNRLRLGRGLPDVLCTENGPEILCCESIAWANSVGMTVQYIQPREPNHNAYIEQFKRTYRNELDLYLIRNLNEVREATHWWKITYNKKQPHDSYGDLTPAEYMLTKAASSTLQLST